MEDNNFKKKAVFYKRFAQTFFRVFCFEKKNENSQTSTHSKVNSKRDDIAERIDQLAGEALRELAKR